MHPALLQEGGVERMRGREASVGTEGCQSGIIVRIRKLCKRTYPSQNGHVRQRSREPV